MLPLLSVLLLAFAYSSRRAPHAVHKVGIPSDIVASWLLCATLAWALTNAPSTMAARHPCELVRDSDGPALASVMRLLPPDGGLKGRSSLRPGQVWGPSPVTFKSQFRPWQSIALLTVL